MIKKFIKKDKKALNTFSAMKKQKVKELEKANISITLKRNNTHLTLANSKGEVIYKQTAGLVGFKGREKRTQLGKRQNIKLFLNAITSAPKIKNLGIVLKNTGRQLRRFFLKETLQFIKTKATNWAIVENFPVAHNGCRKKKLRRI